MSAEVSPKSIVGHYNLKNENNDENLFQEQKLMLKKLKLLRKRQFIIDRKENDYRDDDYVDSLNGNVDYLGKIEEYLENYNSNYNNNNNHNVRSTTPVPIKKLAATLGKDTSSELESTKIPVKPENIITNASSNSLNNLSKNNEKLKNSNSRLIFEEDWIPIAKSALVLYVFKEILAFFIMLFVLRALWTINLRGQYY